MTVGSMRAAVEPEVIDVGEVPEIAQPAAVALAHERSPAEYQARMVMSPEDAKAQADALEAMTLAVLKQDVHFGVIPGTPKPSLYKPGAEWLLKVYGFGHCFTREELDREAGKPYGVTYRCHVTKLLADGRVIEVATCDGYAGRDESDFEQSPWNTVIKMAQKRALVGACLQATGTSGMFTQDLEDSAQPVAGPVVVDANDPWRDVLGNAAGWYDNRRGKKNLKAPDFKATKRNEHWADKGTDQSGNPGPLALWMSDAPEGFVEALALRDEGEEIDWALLEPLSPVVARGKSTAEGVENLKAAELTEQLRAHDLDVSGTPAERIERLRAAIAEEAGESGDREAPGVVLADGESVAPDGASDTVDSPPSTDPADGPTAEEEAFMAAGAACALCGSTRTNRVEVSGKVRCTNAKMCTRRMENRAAKATT